MTVEHSILTHRHFLCTLVISAVSAVTVIFSSNSRLWERDVPTGELSEETSQPISTAGPQQLSAVSANEAFEAGLVVPDAGSFADTKIRSVTNNEPVIPSNGNIAELKQRAMQPGHSNKRFEAIAALGDSEDPLAVFVTEDFLDGVPVEIMEYQVIVDQVDPVRENNWVDGKTRRALVNVPGDITQFTVGAEFLTPGTEYEFEILAIEMNGNATISVGEFVTSE